MESSEVNRKNVLKEFWGKVNLASELGFMQLFTHLPFVLFLILLGVLHIANNHLAEFYVRTIAQKEKQVRQLRWEYVSASAEMMKQSRQSSVAVLVENQGIKPLRVPPHMVEE
jgi:hypothetical protein